MGNNRIIEFDYIRVISLMGILVCHSLLDSWYPIEWLGRLLGMTFNFLFLILSAFLFGTSWEKKGSKKYNLEFIKTRIKKLSKSYYPYLVILFVFLYISQDFFSIRKIISHFIYLPWFDRIGGYGHLWFITMIVLCYIGCVIITRIPQCKLSGKTMALIFLVSICLDYLVTSKGLPGYIFPYLIGYIAVFKYSSTILNVVRRLNNIVNIIQFSIITLLNIGIFYYYKLNPYGFCSYILGIIQAISIFCLIYRTCKNLSESKLIVFLSGISFEIYLVHEFFLGQYSIYKLINNHILSLSIFITLSIVAGYILNIISKTIIKLKKQ